MPASFRLGASLVREDSAVVASSTPFKVVCYQSGRGTRFRVVRRETSENMKGHSKLTKEFTEKIGSGCRRRKGLMYSDGSELREDDPQASAVVAYFKLITDTLAGLPGGEYNDFLKVMGDFKAGRIDLEGVENHLKDVFRGHAELILGLNRFLPDDSEIILSAESEQADQLTTKQQVSTGHMSFKQEKCRKKTKTEKREQDNHGPQVAYNEGDRNPERVPLEQANLQKKIKTRKGKHKNKSHQAAERSNCKTVERMPSTSQNAEELHEVELQMYQLEGRNPTTMWPVDPFNAAEFTTINQMPTVYSKPAASLRTDAANDVQMKKKITRKPAKPRLLNTKMPSLITDIHEKERLFRQCLNQNKLVEDPVSHEQKRKTVNQWTPEEKQLFLEKFEIYRKRFSKIASFMENKTTADCVQYYYLNQKSGDLGLVLRRIQKLKLNRKRAT